MNPSKGFSRLREVTTLEVPDFSSRKIPRRRSLDPEKLDIKLELLPKELDVHQLRKMPISSSRVFERASRTGTPTDDYEENTESALSTPPRYRSQSSLTPRIPRRVNNLLQDDVESVHSSSSCSIDASGGLPQGLGYPNSIPPLSQSTPDLSNAIASTGASPITPAGSPMKAAVNKRVQFAAVESALDAHFPGRRIPAWVAQAMAAAARRLALQEEPSTQHVPHSVFSHVIAEVEEFLYRREKSSTKLFQSAASIRLVGTDCLPPMERLRANKAKPRGRSPEMEDLAHSSPSKIRSRNSHVRNRVPEASKEERAQPDPNETLTRVTEILENQRMPDTF